MELRHLRYFVAVAEERHFGRAAARLHMAQPPLSQQVRQLEAELGVTLLDRTTRRVDLTPAGEAYLTRVRSVLAAVEAAGEEARRIHAGLEGRLVVSCVGSATYSLLPSLARTLREQLPGVDFSFRGEMLSPDQVEGLRDGSVDVALLRPPGDPDAHADLALTTVRRDRYVVAVPEGHPLAERRRVEVEDLRHEGLVVHSGRGRSAMHAAVVTLCREAGFDPDIRHEVAETSTLVTFVAGGLGVAIVPEPVAELGVAGATYRPLATSARLDLVVGTRADDTSALVARALDVVQRETG